MSERTALEIADKLDYLTRSVMSIHNVPTLPKLCDCGEKAANMLRQQHAEIERLKTDAEIVNSCAKNLAIAMHRKNFSHITKWEPLPDTLGLISQIDNMSCWTGGDVAQLTKERDAAISAAVAVKRKACGMKD